MTQLTEQQIVKKQVKMPVLAGMPFGTKDYKLRKVGYDVFEHTFQVVNYPEFGGYQDLILIDSKRVKRVFYK